MCPIDQNTLDIAHCLIERGYVTKTLTYTSHASSRPEPGHRDNSHTTPSRLGQPEDFAFSKKSFLAALAAEQFEFLLQPLISACDEKITSVEILARWNHPQYGTLIPVHFLDDILKANLGGYLTKWVTLQAVITAQLFKHQGISCNISVNVCASDLSQPSFIEILLNTCRNYQVSPDRITIEVTEHEHPTNMDCYIATLTQLRAAGFIVSMDDFGTGYSSLQLLSISPVDQIKLDRSFIKHITTSQKQMKLVKSIVSLCRELEIDMVLEGVETNEQKDIAIELGANCLQGNLIAKPMPLDEFIKLFRSVA